MNPSQQVSAMVVDRVLFVAIIQLPMCKFDADIVEKIIYNDVANRSTQTTKVSEMTNRNLTDDDTLPRNFSDRYTYDNIYEYTHQNQSDPNAYLIDESVLNSTMKTTCKCEHGYPVPAAVSYTHLTLPTIYSV